MTSNQVKCVCGTVLTIPNDQANSTFVCPRCARKLALSPATKRSASVPAAAPSSEPARWYLARDKKKVGPFSSAQLKAMAESGDLRQEDMIWREGRQKWTNAGAVKGLFRAGPEKGAATMKLPARAPMPAQAEIGVESFTPRPDGNPFAELQLMPVEPAAPRSFRSPLANRRGIFWVALGGSACFALAVVVVTLILMRGGSKADDKGTAKNGTGNDANAAPADTARKELDLSYIASDFNAALIIHPSRMLKAPFVGKLLDDKMAADFIKQMGIEPSKIEQLIVLVDPFPFPDGNVAFMPGFIMRFHEPVDGAAVLTKTLEGAEKVTFANKEYYRGKSQTLAKQKDCGCVADDRTLLAGGEDTLKKMLAAKDAPSPLLDYLPKVDLDHDIIVAFAMDQTEEKQKGPTVRKALDEVLQRAKHNLPPNFEGADKIAEQIKAATLALDLTGDTLLKLDLEARDAEAGAALHKLAQNGHDFVKVVVPTFNKEMSKQLPPDLGKPVTALVGELVNGLSLTKDGNRVVLTMKMPKELPGVVEKAQSALKDFKPRPPPGIKKAAPAGKGPPASGKKTTK
jgi:hypothetical protein